MTEDSLNQCSYFGEAYRTTQFAKAMIIPLLQVGTFSLVSRAMLNFNYPKRISQYTEAFQEEWKR